MLRNLKNGKGKNFHTTTN